MPGIRQRHGISLSSYVIGGALIAIVAIVATRTIGLNTQCVYQTVGHRVQNTSQTAAGCAQNNGDELVWLGTAGADHVYTLGLATTDQSYTQSIPFYASSKTLQATGYRLAGGTTLPNGLSLTNNGTITGTPSSNPNNPAVTTTIQVQAYDPNATTSTNLYITIPVKGKYTFAYTGGTQYFHAPASLTSTTWKLWGAAGGGSKSNQSLSGAGGYATATITNTQDTTLEVLVGGGGQPGPGDGAVGGGGPITIPPYNPNVVVLYGGRGGGGTFVYGQNTPLIVAGGGGGADGATWASANINAGAGGGYTGIDGYQYLNSFYGEWPNHAGDGGTGGTQTHGGYSGDGTCSCRSTTYDARSNGSFGTGGTGVSIDNASEGSGGGGYYGGGAGRDDYGDGLGGGGSSYVGGGSNGYTESGNGNNPGNADDPDKQPSVGNAAVPQSSGGNGQATVTWGP